MTIYEYGNPDADTVLIQLTGDHELSVLKNEVEEIRKRTSTDFRLIAAKVDDWNYELSPWKAPAVFGNEDFGDGAVRTLEQILTLCTDKSRTYYIGGYSLAGLFSLWAAYQTDVFSGIAAASPSGLQRRQGHTAVVARRLVVVVAQRPLVAAFAWGRNR